MNASKIFKLSFVVGIAAYSARSYAAELDWNIQVVVRPGANICTLSPTIWGEKDHCHKLTGDVAIERVDQPPNKGWIRVVTMDDTEEPPFYVKIADLENYSLNGQSWSKIGDH